MIDWSKDIEDIKLLLGLRVERKYISQEVKPPKKMKMTPGWKTNKHKNSGHTLERTI